MKPKLCQIIALVSGKKTEAQKTLTNAHNHRMKEGMLNGLIRSYRPIKEDGEQLPPEIKHVQATIPAVIKDVRPTLVDLFDVVLTQDVGNTIAKADVAVNGTTILSNVPVTYLLFLEKQVVDLTTFIEKLPILDPSEEWTPDPDIGGFTTKPYETLKAAKVYKTHVAHPPTKEHPAQVQTYTVDETIGVWTNIKKSGALRQQDKTAMLARVNALRDAIKTAREAANGIEIDQMKAGEAVLGFVFGA